MKKNLVAMTKDSETIDVHPSCVEDHKSLGWKVAGEETASEAPAESKPEGEKPRRSSRKQNKPAE